MQEFVIDANILISMLISGKASYKPILTYFKFYTPDYAFDEIEKYKSQIIEKTRLDSQEFQRFTFFIFNHISVFPNFILSNEAIEKAYKIRHDVDIKDISYVALAIEFNCFLLTRDKQLAKGLKKKGFRKVMVLEDFLNGI